MVVVLWDGQEIDMLEKTDQLYTRLSFGNYSIERQILILYNVGTDLKVMDLQSLLAATPSPGWSSNPRARVRYSFSAVLTLIIKVHLA